MSQIEVQDELQEEIVSCGEDSEGCLASPESLVIKETPQEVSITNSDFPISWIIAAAALFTIAASSVVISLSILHSKIKRNKA